MLLTNKTAVIYGAGGAVGSATAQAFAREGAKVVLAGRSRESLDMVAADITDAGGRAIVMPVDALDTRAVNHHLTEVRAQLGSVDISFNSIGIDDVQGKPIVEMDIEDFVQPITIAMRTQFITGTAASRFMAEQGSGVILALTAQAARVPSANTGGFGVACAAIEAFCRQLAKEAGASGVRVVCLRSTGSPDTPGVDEVFKLHAKRKGISREEFEMRLADSTMLKKLPHLADVAKVAVIMASDYASYITGAIANVTAGEIAD